MLHRRGAGSAGAPAVATWLPAQANRHLSGAALPGALLFVVVTLPADVVRALHQD